jgi:hypothetical protein
MVRETLRGKCPDIILKFDGRIWLPATRALVSVEVCTEPVQFSGTKALIPQKAGRSVRAAPEISAGSTFRIL